MTRIPQTIREPWGRALKRAQRSISTGSIPVDVVEELIAMVVAQHEEARREDREFREITGYLLNRISALGGGTDTRGAWAEPRGLMVKHGIHTVVEDSR
jgi:hypothetical protein